MGDRVSKDNEAPKVNHSQRQEQFWAEPSIGITGSPSFPPGLLKFISAIVSNIHYSTWFAVQVGPGCSFLTPPQTHLIAPQEYLLPTQLSDHSPAF